MDNKQLNETYNEALLSDEEVATMPAYFAGEKDFYGTAAFDKLYKYFADEMPYGIAKARTGDPDFWILNKLGE